MKNDKVSINLRRNEALDVVEVPVKGSPTTGIFCLIPSQQPELGKQIDKVVWKAQDKTIQVDIKETPDLGVCRWMEYIHQRQKQIKEGPFVDLDEDALILKMFDSQNREVARLKFQNISLQDHHCKFCKDSTSNLTHYLVVEYQQCDLIDLDEKFEHPDLEWKSVEI